MPDFNYILAAVGIMLLAGALSNKLSSRFNLPILILFLLFGGISGYGYIPSDRAYSSINILGTVAMSFILFSGGLDTSFRHVKNVLVPGGILATLGVLITAVLLGIGTFFIAPEILTVPNHDGNAATVPLSKTLTVAMLLGAMISSTDAAAVFAILSGKNVGLKGRLRPALELESGSNDPMAYFLTILVVDILLGKSEFGVMTLLVLIYRMAAGIMCGWIAGRLAKYLYKIKLEYEGLYFVFIIAMVFFTYGFTEVIRGNGMMACYVCGMTMAHFRFNYQKSISRFSDGVSWLMQVALFTALGLFANVKLLPDLLLQGALLSCFLMFIARPVAVMLTMPRRWFSFREKIFISWVGLRGAAPIVLATFPLANFPNAPGEPAAGNLFNLIFIMVLFSLIIQGTTLMPLARKLALDKPASSRERSPLELEQTSASKGSIMFEFIVGEESLFCGKTMAEAGIPSALLVTMIRRGNSIIQPRGGTEIKSGDGLTVMGSFEALNEFAGEYFPEDKSPSMARR